MLGRLLQAVVHGPCKDRILAQWLQLCSWGKASIENITPRALDSILLCVLLGHELVLEPPFSPIASNPLDSSLALIVILFRICFIDFWQILGQIL